MAMVSCHTTSKRKKESAILILSQDKIPRRKQLVKPRDKYRLLITASRVALVHALSSFDVLRNRFSGDKPGGTDLQAFEVTEPEHPPNMINVKA